MNNNTKIVAAGLAALVATAAGCMSTPDSSPGFGQSVANMTHQQTYDHAAALVPPEDTMRAMDGGAAESAVTGYRQAAQPASDTVENEIHINVGN